jgi:hypothetical protein
VASRPRRGNMFGCKDMGSGPGAVRYNPGVAAIEGRLDLRRAMDLARQWNKGCSQV